MGTSDWRYRAAYLTRITPLALAFILWSSPAWAHFDVVSLYQEKVKGFDVIYYLTKDETWHRDRRIVDFFGQWDQFGDYMNVSGGLLFNVKPENGDVQLSFFNMFSGNQLLQDEFRNWEALHGARLTISDWVELSAGAHWRQVAESPQVPGIDPATRGKFDAAAFFELNIPIIYVLSSYVVSFERLQRLDLRFDYNTNPYFDSVSAGLIRYSYDETKWVVRATLSRLGHPKFRFFTLDVRCAFDGFMDLKTGFDYVLMLDNDFNATRRGHFGTSFGFRAMYNFMDTSNLAIFGKHLSGDLKHGFTGEIYAQVPAKWVLTALTVASAAYSGKAEDIERATEMLADTIEHPEDIFFSRVGFQYSYNDPDSFGLPVPEVEDLHRFFVTLSFIY